MPPSNRINRAHGRCRTLRPRSQQHPAANLVGGRLPRHPTTLSDHRQPLNLVKARATRGGGPTRTGRARAVPGLRRGHCPTHVRVQSAPSGRRRRPARTSSRLNATTSVVQSNDASRQFATGLPCDAEESRVCATPEDTRQHHWLNFGLPLTDQEAVVARVGCRLPIAERQSNVPTEAWLLSYQGQPALGPRRLLLRPLVNQESCGCAVVC